MSWVAAAVVGSAVVTSYVSSKAAKSAAKAQKEAAYTGAQATLEANRESIKAQEDALERQIELNEPFRKVGVKALPILEAEINAGAPTFDEFVSSPEAAKIREQELKDISLATERTAASRGNLFAPRTQLELQNKALQKTAASKLGQYENVLSRRERQLGHITDLVNIGRGASTQQAGAMGDAGANISNIISAGGRDVANLNLAAGNARTSGYINSANAITGGINSSVSNLLLMNQLNTPKNNTVNLNEGPLG